MDIFCIYLQTPPPKVPPRKSGFATSMGKGGFQSIIMSGTVENKSKAFDMGELVKTLNDKQKKYAASVLANSTAGVENIMEETITDKKKDYDKDKTIKSLSFMSKKNPVTEETVDVELEETMKPVDPRQMVNLVVHTLTQIFPRVGKDFLVSKCQVSSFR